MGLACIPRDKNVNSATMYMLKTAPLDFAGAISERYSGATTVRPPAPRPPHIRAKSINPSMPEENICISSPLIHVRVNICQERSLPSLSQIATARKAPNAAPRTPKDEMLAFLSASPLGLSFHRDDSRPKSRWKDLSPMEALKPPSSYPNPLRKQKPPSGK